MRIGPLLPETLSAIAFFHTSTKKWLTPKPHQKNADGKILCGQARYADRPAITVYTNEHSGTISDAK